VRAHARSLDGTLVRVEKLTGHQIYATRYSTAEELFCALRVKYYGAEELQVVKPFVLTASDHIANYF